MKEKELYAWIRLILIEAGYEEQKPYSKCHFVTWRPKYDFVHEEEINNWIKENHLKNNNMNPTVIILKQTPIERTVMYGYDHDTISSVISRIDIEGIVPVYKREWLLDQPEDFWKDLVEPKKLGNSIWFLVYETVNDSAITYCDSAKESGLSALSQVKGEYILIVRELI